MAVLKHLAIKNMNFTDSIHYLLFNHDEFTQELILDEYGVPVMREDYWFEGINCDPFSYDFECEDVNRTFHKNTGYDEIKQHHYILSFDPKDSTECGLTGERAQAIGMEFARENFPGHQTIVCTHLDGHNHSGNIHVHIVLNSVRKTDVDRKPFMERDIDCKAGYKHHLTPRLLVHLKQEVMNLCNREHLHQVDLLSPAKNRVTTREYYARKRAAERNTGADRISAEPKAHATGIMESADIPKDEPGEKRKDKKPTKFESLKDSLRHAIADVAKNSVSEKAFADSLSEKYGITLKISRGRYAYLVPERAKPIRGRMLGNDYIETHLRDVFAENRVRLSQESIRTDSAEIAEETEISHKHESAIPLAEDITATTGKDNSRQTQTSAPQENTPETDIAENYTGAEDVIRTNEKKNESLEMDPVTGTRTNIEKGSVPTTFDTEPSLPSAITIDSSLRLVTDLQSNIKAQASYAYARKVRLTNLQTMADTVAYAQTHGFDSMDSIEKTHDSLLTKLQNTNRQLDSVNTALRDTNEMIHYTGQYYANKKIYAQYLKSGRNQNFKMNHYEAIVKYETARDFLKKKAGGSKLPPLVAQNKEKERLLAKREDIKRQLANDRKNLDRFKIIKSNIEYILDLPNRQRSSDRQQPTVQKAPDHRPTR